jgi:hypothetical protein
MGSGPDDRNRGRLFRTFAYLGLCSASVISLSPGTSASDAGFQRPAWVMLGIGVAFVVLTAADRAIPVVVHGAEATAGHQGKSDEQDDPDRERQCE